jgi:transglutaminase-like putative cysteine protease
MDNYLKETKFLDFNNPAFDEFVSSISKNKSKKEIAVDLYFLVRDAFLYDPYHLDISHEGLIASSVLPEKRAWCVEKSIVLAACARKFEIPSRLGYAIVTNHIGVEKLTAYLKRPEIVFHGYVELFINEKWLKCTPSFDKQICRLANVTPLDWNGETDSMFQEYDKGNKFMEYLHFYGDFEDVPVELMNAEMEKYYPHLFEKQYESKAFSFKHI